MALLGGQSNVHQLASLDNLGMLAGVYPSEEVLWAQGPPITDPGAQGVAYPGENGTPEPLPAPASLAQASAMEGWLHDQINGPTPVGAYGEEWVPTGVAAGQDGHGATGFGNWNEQPYFSGHSQIVQSNPAAEQGWGVGPARRWAHYPLSEGPNPARNMGQHLRNGALAWTYPEINMLYYRTQLIWEQQWDPYKRRGVVSPVVPVPTSVPFVQTVPQYAGGPAAIPTLDVPALGPDQGIY